MANDKEIVGMPQPDPWAPPGANATQAASIGAGATGAALLIGDQVAGSDQGALALIPDPAQAISSLAHLLGFQVSTSTLWTVGLVLVVLSVLLNVYSYALRVQYAKRVEAEYAAQQAAKDAKEASVQRQAKAQGFIGGDV